jgi:hypothetical protein
MVRLQAGRKHQHQTYKSSIECAELTLRLVKPRGHCDGEGKTEDTPELAFAHRRCFRAARSAY